MSCFPDFLRSLSSRRPVIAFFSANEHLGHSFGWVDLHANAAVLAVFAFVGGVISDHILVLYLDRDLRTDVLEVIGGSREEAASACKLNDVVDGAFSGIASASGNRNHVNLDVLFFGVIAYLSEAVTAVVIAAIGDHEQKLPGIRSLAH